MDYEEEPSQEQLLDREELLERTEDEEDQQQWLQDQAPQVKKPESLFGLFKNVWKTNDSSKVGNLNTTELGALSISVRGCQHLAMLGQAFKHEKFGAFFKQQGELVLATSASKKGWFTELFVSQKKYSQRTLGNPSTPTNQPKSSWSIRNLMGGSQETPQTPQTQ